MVEYDKRSIRSWSLLGIAPSIFINAVADVMHNDPNCILATADTGRYCGFQKMPEDLMDRIFDFGIAEQSLFGSAAGLALSGKQVFVTTYAPFLTFRCADQMRHLMGNMNLNMKAIGTAAGFTAAASGNALNALSDFAFTRAIPNMTVLSPADCTEAMKMITAMAKIEGPVYMRFCGLTGLPVVYFEDFPYKLGKANVLQRGERIAILATGTTVVSEALRAGKWLLEHCGIQCTVADIHTIKPFDVEFVSSLLHDHSLFVTAEEHSVIGGLGSAVAESLSDLGAQKKLIRLGAEDAVGSLGSRGYMLRRCGLTAEGIAQTIETQVEKMEGL